MGTGSSTDANQQPHPSSVEVDPVHVSPARGNWWEGEICNRSNDDWHVNIQGNAGVVPEHSLDLTLHRDGPIDDGRKGRGGSHTVARMQTLIIRYRADDSGIPSDLLDKSSPLDIEGPYVGQGVLTLTRASLPPQPAIEVHFALHRGRHVIFFRGISKQFGELPNRTAGLRDFVDVDGFEAEARTHGIALDRRSNAYGVDGEKKRGDFVLFG